MYNQLFVFLKMNKKFGILTLIFIGTGFCIFFFSYYYSCLASYFFGGEKSPKGEFLKVVLQTIGGAFIFIGAWAALLQVKIARQNNLTEKLKNTIEQLGSTKNSIVISSLHALNQIALNNKDLLQQVISTFINQIRDRMNTERDWNSLTLTEKQAYRLPTEVQTILDLLFRSKEKQFYKNITIDLSNCRLYRANLNYADMRNVYLDKAQLQGAFLSHANFSGVYLQGADLSDTQLHETNFLGATLSNSNFVSAELISTRFQFAKLMDSHFENSYLSDVHFESAFMSNAIFIGCSSFDSNFNGASLSKADFSGSRLVRQQFICSNLMGTKYYGSYLKETNFKGAILVYTCFNGACSKLNTEREELAFDFLNLIKQRIDKETEFDKTIYFGKLSNEEKNQVIADFKKEVTEKPLILNFIQSLSSPLFKDTTEVDKGILSKDKAQNLLNQFNDAIKVPEIRL
jgi:uncharacterized protein YjbI with pentapeptide repeats